MIPRPCRGVTQYLGRQLTLLQGNWFDLTHGVSTSGRISLQSLNVIAATAKSGFDYLPTRPARARQILADLPIKDYSRYSFIDLGSGKGRVLLIAAEFPFYDIQGVEFAAELHNQAVDNILRCRRRNWRCRRLQSIHLDAVDYRFPPRDLVVYLFNPFGPPVLEKVLQNLRVAVACSPRHLVLVLHTPDHASVIESLNWLNCHRRTPQYIIYQTQTA